MKAECSIRNVIEVWSKRSKVDVPAWSEVRLHRADSWAAVKQTKALQIFVWAILCILVCV